MTKPKNHLVLVLQTRDDKQVLGEVELGRFSPTSFAPAREAIARLFSDSTTHETAEGKK